MKNIVSVWVVGRYRDEVSCPAVDVHAVIIHTDHLSGLGHEEGGTAELRMLRCEGELTLHRHHVQTTWGTHTDSYVDAFVCLQTRT